MSIEKLAYALVSYHPNSLISNIRVIRDAYDINIQEAKKCMEDAELQYAKDHPENWRDHIRQGAHELIIAALTIRFGKIFNRYEHNTDFGELWVFEVNETTFNVFRPVYQYNGEYSVVSYKNGDKQYSWSGIDEYTVECILTTNNR